MFNAHEFEAIAKKLYATLPDNFQTLDHDLQQKFKEILKSAFDRLDLVTREEFDVQVKVLARTREKVEALQMQLNQLLEAKKIE